MLEASGRLSWAANQKSPKLQKVRQKYDLTSFFQNTPPLINNNFPSQNLYVSKSDIFLGLYLFGCRFTGWIYQRLHRTWISLVCQSIHNYMVWNYKEKNLIVVKLDPIYWLVCLFGHYMQIVIFQNHFWKM